MAARARETAASSAAAARTQLLPSSLRVRRVAADAYVRIDSASAAALELVCQQSAVGRTRSSAGSLLALLDSAVTRGGGAPPASPPATASPFCRPPSLPAGRRR